MGEFGRKFTQNFIEDSRYMFLVKGLGNTLLITLFAVALGLILGFLIAIIRVTRDKTGKLKFLDLIARAYLTVIRGTPVMVQLLIMYYVIFATSSMSKVVVAILAFGINSGAYVSDLSENVDLHIIQIFILSNCHCLIFPFDLVSDHCRSSQIICYIHQLVGSRHDL